MTVLLVEPDNKLANIYKQYLQTAGHQVYISKGAQEAVQLADEYRPDIVVLELQLTGHSGVEFLYEFRSYPEWTGIPVLLHTLVPPQSLTISEPLIEQLNIQGYLYKPATSLRKLAHAIDETLVAVNP